MFQVISKCFVSLNNYTGQSWLIFCRHPLTQICVQPDAQRKTNGLSPVLAEVIQIMIWDSQYWSLLKQLIKTCKPLVDAIGNLESHNANLTDCMLELIQCAWQMLWIELEADEDVGFWVHTKAVFNHEFHGMNTELHNLALFLHPMCRKLAIFQAAKGRSFDEVCKMSLGIARQWCWDEGRAVGLWKTWSSIIIAKVLSLEDKPMQWNGGRIWRSQPINIPSKPSRSRFLQSFHTPLMSNDSSPTWRAFKA